MTAAPQRALARILEALQADLIDATEEEIAAALADLGMSRSTRASAALIDLKYPAIRRHFETLYNIAPAEPDCEEDDALPSAHPPDVPRYNR